MMLKTILNGALACALMLAGLTDPALGQAGAEAPRPQPGETVEAFADRMLVEGKGVEAARGGTAGYALGWQSNSLLDGNSIVELTDLEGNLIIAFEDSTSNRMRVRKIAIGGDAPQVIWDTSIDVIRRPRAIVADLDGTIYVAGLGRRVEEPDNLQFFNNAVVAKLRPSNGAVLWESAAFDQTSMLDLAVDREGAPYAMIDSTSLSGQTQVRRLDPLTGLSTWEVNVGSDAADGRLLIDRSGDLTVVENTGSVLRWRRLTPFGVERWLTTRSVNVSLRDAALGPENNAYVLVRRDSDREAQLYGVNSEGVTLWTLTLQPGGDESPPQDLEITRAGDIIVAINDGANQVGRAVVQAWSPGAAKLWEWRGPLIFGNDNLSPDAGIDVAIDRLDNVYVHTAVDDGGFAARYVAKIDDPSLDMDPGATVWEDQRDLAIGEYYVRGMVVDNGGNVIAIGKSDTPSLELLTLLKLTQPFVAIPTRVTACPNLMIEEQGVWFPGTAGLIESGPIFDFDPTFGESLFPITFGEVELGFGGTVTFDADTTYDLGNQPGVEVGYRAEINGGTMETHLPLDVEFLIPGFEKLFAGMRVPPIQVDYTIDPAARFTSYATPTVDAGLTAETTGSISVSVYAEAFGGTVIDRTLFREDWDFSPPEYIPPLHVLGLIGLFGLPVPGEWITISDNNAIFSGSFRIPKLSTKAAFTPGAGENGFDGAFTGVAAANFFELRVSLTQAILKAFGLSLDFSKELGEEGDFVRASFSVALLQLLFGADFEAQQRLDLEITPWVRYELSDGAQLLDASGNVVSPPELPLDDAFSFDLPSDGTITITPFVFAKARFNNDTDLSIQPAGDINPLEFSVAAAFKSFSIIGLSECILCTELPIPDIFPAIDIYERGWDLEFPEVELAPMKLIGKTNLRPGLADASRESLSMIIYDQTSPSPLQVANATIGTSNMLLYGENFFPASRAVIAHHGREETLDSQILNLKTMLVKIPDRFRLLPGVASIWVNSPYGESASISLPIAYPTPRLDTVNPNLWAADPDMNALPVSVIDGRTPAGNDTFIARRDYYALLDDLWDPRIDPVDATYGRAPDRPINDFSTFDDFLIVPDGGEIVDLNIELIIEHGHNPDLIVRLSKGDTTVTLISQTQGPGPFGNPDNGFEITLDDEGTGGPIETADGGGGIVFSPPSYTPEQPLSTFDGMDSAGTWTLQVTDVGDGDTGTLKSWALDFDRGGAPVEVAIEDYFPCFDFDMMPAFPAVLFDSVPMERFIQPVDSGIHNVRLAESDYDTPRRVSVVLCNPGPGGGASEPKELIIAAPRPLVSALEPAQVQPDTEDFELIVRGPVHVPYFEGYEEPKYGNFNRASVIRFDGVDMPTKFLGSAELRTTIPASMINGSGNHQVSVYTPDNDTVYFDPNFGTVPFGGDSELNYVPSGGESNHAIFRVKWNTPRITMLSPPSVEVGSLAMEPRFRRTERGEEPMENLTVCGTDFRPGAIVYIGNEPRHTTYVNHDMVRVILLPEDIESIGIVRLRVENPNGYISPTVDLEIRPEEAPEAQRPGKSAAIGKGASASP